MTLEDQLKSVILEKYKSVRSFTEKNNIPYSTIDSILKRGISNAGVGTIIKVFSDLELDVGSIPSGTLKPQTIKKAFSLSEKALEIARKYEKLDQHGKEMVDVVLEKETARVNAAVRKEQEEDNISEIHPLVKVIHLYHTWDKASAGTGFELSEERSDRWAVEYNDLTRRADFCTTVKGRSMEPMFYDGDVILIRKQPSVEIGEIGLFTKDGKGYVKRMGETELESVNPDFENVAPADGLECKGKVLGVLNPEWVFEQ